MIDINKLIEIAGYLTTEKKYKGHGYWEIYENDKIKIMYDTYYPNVSVYIKIDGKEELVLLHSGHGITQEYHSGAWENYCENILFPRATRAKQLYILKENEKLEKEKFKKFCSIDDSKVFGI